MLFKFKKLLIILSLMSSALLVSCNNSVETNNPINSEEDIEIIDSEEQKNDVEKQKAERENLEKQRKEKLGEFYVPLLPLGENKEKKNTEVKALYLTGHTAGNELRKPYIDAYGEYVKALSENNAKKAAGLKEVAEQANKFERIIGIAVGTEINGLVINVKDDNGLMTYDSNVKIVQEMNQNTPIPIKDIKGMLKILQDYDIYTIGRIVTFKDKNFAEHKPAHAIQLKSGGTWYDKNSNNVPWVNPFDKYVWDYNIAIAKEAALMGFDEIQFDYVRFPDGAKYYNQITEFPGRNNRDKDEAIAEFLKYSKEELEPYNINIGADVFGIITRTWDDFPEDIGQSWILMGEHVDNIAPMIYPSHYSTGWYNLENPNANPYLVVKGSMQEALEKNSSMENPSVIRPWIQDFDWEGIEYGPKEVRAQIIAAKELGINEYMIWNPSNVYDPHCYIETSAEKGKTYPIDKGELDFAEKSPQDAADKYMSGKLNKRFSYMYLMTPIKDRDSDFDKFLEIQEKNEIVLKSYKIYGYEINSKDNNKAIVDLYYKYETLVDGKVKIVEKDHAKWQAVKENGIWKIEENFN